MVITLLALGITALVVLLSIYVYRPSVQSSNSAHSGQRSLSLNGVNKRDETELSQASNPGDEGSLPPLDISSDQKPGEQTSVLVATGPESVEHGSSQNSSQTGSGFFNNAQNVVLYHPVMNNINDAKEKVLKWLAKFTMSGVEFDASGHVPGCHPGTRIAILEKLHHWVGDPQRTHQMLWLRGAAGVGKSAILQSLAEQLSESSKLGATLFFSRPNNRNNSAFVFPTIAYQLAVRIPPYKEYLNQIMLRDPKLLEKDMERQFNALIVEPFTTLGLTGDDCKWAVLLDGLDECDEEGAQILLIELINRFSRQYSASPLVWVIASRPEAHLQLTFSSQEVVGSFEEFIVAVDSDDACRDVEKFLRAKFKEIHQKYRDVVPAGVPWPEERDITRISKTSSGLFALATTVARYIEDPHVCNPISQLTTALSVTEGLEPGSLSTLYAFYAVILSNIPQPMSPILKLLLPFYAVLLQELTALTGNDSTPGYFPLVIVATIFGLQQHTIYAALRKLHSVIKVPPVNESGRRGIEFYHASFSDYLKTQGGYTLDVGMMTKMWWGYFNLLHGMDSTSYRTAISRRRPPVPLSWDVKLVDGASENLWEVGLGWFMHTLVPECRTQKKYSYTHSHSLLAGLEICNVFEKIDFSTLFFTPIQRRIFAQILDLFNWLVSDAPPEAVQSNLVKTISLRDLDLGCIPEEKMALEFNWGVGSSMTITSYANSRTHPTQPLWVNPANSLKKIASKLNELNRHNMVIRALLVGRAPSRRCAFIYVEPTGKRRSSFYYVPYRK